MAATHMNICPTVTTHWTFLECQRGWWAGGNAALHITTTVTNRLCTRSHTSLVCLYRPKKLSTLLLKRFCQQFDRDLVVRRMWSCVRCKTERQGEGKRHHIMLKKCTNPSSSRKTHFRSFKSRCRHLIAPQIPAALKRVWLLVIVCDLS